MLHFFSELALSIIDYLLFIITVIAVLAVIAVSKKRNSSRVSFTNLKKQSKANKKSFLEEISDDKDFIKSKLSDSNSKVSPANNVFVVDFEGGVDAKTETGFMEEVDAVIDAASDGDELVIRLKSGGGYVFAYGSSSDKIAYAKSKGLKVTAIVDEVAASGGYMMASVADKIIGAPFSIIGSIGVVSGQMNFYQAMKDHGIKYELFTAGENKRVVTPFTEVEEHHREKVKKDMENTHRLFIEHIRKHRDIEELETLADGDVWYGQEAKEKGLIDEIGTSWEYIENAGKQSNVLLVKNKPKQKMKDKISDVLSASIIKSYQSITKISVDSKVTKF